MIYYTGDIHGSAKGIAAFAQHYELTESDVIAILGDVGANYYGNRRDMYCKDDLARMKPTVFCIHGNHERRPATLSGYKQKEWNGGRVWYEDDYPNLLFARDGDIFTMEGTRHLVIGVLQTKVNRKNEKSPAKFTRPKMGITKQAGEKSHRQPG